jgi:hypothetical protein
MQVEVVVVVEFEYKDTMAEHLNRGEQRQAHLDCKDKGYQQYTVRLPAKEVNKAYLL